MSSKSAYRRGDPNLVEDREKLLKIVDKKEILGVFEILTFEKKVLFVFYNYKESKIKDIQCSFMKDYKHKYYNNIHFFCSDTDEVVTIDENLDKTVEQIGLSRFANIELKNLKNISRKKILKEKKGQIDKNKMIQIVVKTLTGKKILIDCYFNDTVERLKELIQNKEGIHPDQMRLIYAGRQLEDLQKLYQYEIEEGSTIHLVLRLKGAILHETSGKSGNYEQLNVVVVDPHKIYDLNKIVEKISL